MKLSDLTDEDWFKRLQARRDAQTMAIRQWWEYYEGRQPLYYVAKILAEQSDRFPALTINWSEKFIDSIDRRMFVEGFILGGNDEPDMDLWATWLRNDMPEFQSENNVASLVTDNSYIMVGPSDEGALVTVESPESMAVEIDPRTRRVIGSLKFYKQDQEATVDDRAVLQIPDSSGGSRLVEFENGKPVGEKQQKWMTAAQRLQSSPEIPVVQFPNRQRQRVGRSELWSLKPIVDAANQVATNMMAAVEHHAVPRKWMLGANKESFTDEAGNPLPAYKIATGAVWINPYDAENPDAKPEVGQFAASDLRNFHDTLSTLARIGSGLCDLPPHSLGFGVSDNPASADGIRASENDMVARVERHMVARGNGYERVMRLAMAVEGRDPATATGLETVWRNPATPTQAAKADAAVKMFGAGLTDKRQARVDYGYSLTTIEAMEGRESDMGSDPALADAVAALNAQQAQAEAQANGSARGA